jgi:hypothetical protein
MTTVRPKTNESQAATLYTLGPSTPLFRSWLQASVSGQKCVGYGTPKNMAPSLYKSVTIFSRLARQATLSTALDFVSSHQATTIVATISVPIVVTIVAYKDAPGFSHIFGPPLHLNYIFNLKILTG